mmetsp:Transcript_51603/g.144188  ORF Transcript_51603/g.144188 Transcript_51603/m.144188 type:complete len:674 (+) Transcript_51603:120-2141(+)
MATDFTVSVTAHPGAIDFDQVPMSEGVQAWSDSDEKLIEVPTQLLGGTLLRGARDALVPTTTLTVDVAGTDARLYVAAELPKPEKQVHGSLVLALSTTRRWTAEDCSMAWGHGRDEIALFSTIVRNGTSVDLPDVRDAGALLILVAVPVVTGSFAVSVLSNTGTPEEKLVIVEEGVVAWKDRDHCYFDVPRFLLGGVLYQGPHKDVPDGTVCSVRPNSRARVYVVTERTCSGGFVDSLPAQGWVKEQGAPRWHDVATMVMFSRDCAAGCALVLPPTRNNGAVFSIIIVPSQNALFAPVEVSCTSPASAASGLDLVSLSEGMPIWYDDAERLERVPEWMLGATMARGGRAGPPQGARFGVRAAGPSVVYAVIEDAQEAMQLGLQPQTLLAAGWERRNEAPQLGSGSPLAVYAKRIGARESLCVPPFTEAGSTFALVVKVDVEAFDASVETSAGFEYNRTSMQETVVVWTDRPHRYAWLTPSILGGFLFRGPHNATPSGTIIRIRASGAFRAYVIVEADYKAKAGRSEGQYVGPARNGGFLSTLPNTGWRKEVGSPSWGDTASVMKILSCRATEGMELLLPPTVGEIVFSIVVVNVASSAERLAEELRQSFQAWDPEEQGAISREDLDGLLSALCPELDDDGRKAFLAYADRAGTGRISYKELVDWLMSEASPVS